MWCALPQEITEVHLKRAGPLWPQQNGKPEPQQRKRREPAGIWWAEASRPAGLDQARGGGPGNVFEENRMKEIENPVLDQKETFSSVWDWITYTHTVKQIKRQERKCHFRNARVWIIFMKSRYYRHWSNLTKLYRENTWVRNRSESQIILSTVESPFTISKF